MADRLVLALAQLNPVAGDIAGNSKKLMTVWSEAARQGADLLVASELYITGYPPEDFALNPNLQKAIRDAVEALARKTASGPAVLAGAPWVVEGKLYNAALLLDGGYIAATVLKHDLPNYGPFDEKRVYEPGPLPDPVSFRGFRLGFMVCEDMWSPDVSEHLHKSGAQMLIVINGSPFEPGKQKLRINLARNRVRETGLPLVYVNQTGGQDELVFEGSSFAIDAAGDVRAQAKAWSEDVLLTTWNALQNGLVPEESSLPVLPAGEVAVYYALMTGLRDYVAKNGFHRVLLGLSGGVDSALTAALAVDALGADRVRLVMMPSPYTSPESLDDALAVARALGCRLDTIPITDAMHAFEQTLGEAFAGCQPDVTEENIQARCRGIILMALANKSRAMVLATGNKSEMATGYATLYGDMCGGYAPLKDVYKTMVYALARLRNAQKPIGALGPLAAIIPDRVLTKAPTAELRPDQTDQDTLPPYDVLDGILGCLIEEDLSLAEIVNRGYDALTVQKVWKMLDRAEYKRRQAPPGPKVTSRHLTRDRRYPITNGFVE
ncbi:MAG: NAD+ synthase [Alphaproteobacteria bacterium]|nr:NAD+ synthase [Alphaproteobacteria bacterium]